MKLSKLNKLSSKEVLDQISILIVSILVLASIYSLVYISSFSNDYPTNSNISQNKTPYLENIDEDNNSRIFRNRYNKTASERYIKEFYRSDIPFRQEDKADINHSSMIYEVDRFVKGGVRDIHVENAWTLYNKTFEIAREKGWFNYRKAIEDGFDNPYSRDHYVNIEHFRDNESLNPEEPEFLMFRNNSSEEKVLIGVMYMINDVEGEGRQIGGSITKWHYHAYPRTTCYYNGYPVNKTSECPEKYISNKSPEMLHVWFIENKDGVFGTRMSVPQKFVDQGPVKTNKSKFTKEVRSMHSNSKLK